MGLGVDNPLWLLTFIPVLFVLFLFWKNQRNIPLSRKIIIVSTRAVMFTLLIFAISGLHMLWPVKDIATVFVADRSDSMAGQEEKVITFITEAMEAKTEVDKAAVVTVGAEAMIEKPLSSKIADSFSFQTIVETSYTNLASGLQLAGSIFTSDERGRVVVLSDGNENIGDVKKQAEFLHRQGFVVDVVPYSPTRTEDVALKRINIPETSYLGEEVSMTVEIESNIDTSSELIIYEDSKVISKDQVQLSEGTNSFSFQHIVEETGFHSYRAEIVANRDTILENNKNFAFSETNGMPKVLGVEGSENAARNLSSVLNSSIVDVEVIPTELLPTSLGSYLSYQTIIFSNVSATTISQSQMELIETAVKDFGVGFIMTGGNDSYGLGGYFKTPIENLLPVEMEVKGKKELPSLGLVVVLDRSGSMSGHKIELAREAAARSVALLRDTDTLGVIAFDDMPWQIVETGPINDKKKVEEQILTINPGGGTSIFPALEEAYEQLEALDLQRKHIILLTDGQSPAPSNYQQIIEAGAEENITISTVAVGEGADVTLLEELANIGGGRFYNVLDVSSIPTIFSRETTLMTRTYIIDDPFYPSLANGYEWTPLLGEGLPQLNAYIATTIKDRAQSVLVSEQGDPILSRWQYGLGKTIAWTPDLAGWAGEWPGWEKWPQVWNELVTWTFPQFEQKPYDVSVSTHGNKVSVAITSSEVTTTDVEAVLLNEVGEKIEFPLQIKSPGEYNGEFTTSKPGTYFLQLNEKEGEQILGTFKTGIVVPYSQEYNFNQENLLLLEQVAEAGGGTVLTKPEEAFINNLPNKNREQPIFYPLLLIALFLFLIDVALRRFQFSFAFVDGIARKMKEKQESNKVTLETKQKQFEQLKSASKRRTTIPNKDKDHNDVEKRTVLQADQKLKPKPNEKGRTQSKQSEQAISQPTDRKERMNRLLDAKNKRNR